MTCRRVPEERHAELAVLDRLEDDALYTVARFFDRLATISK
jgi:hypothetical protein